MKKVYALLCFSPTIALYIWSVHRCFTVDVLNQASFSNLVAFLATIVGTAVIFIMSNALGFHFLSKD